MRGQCRLARVLGDLASLFGNAARALTFGAKLFGLGALPLGDVPAFVLEHAAHLVELPALLGFDPGIFCDTPLPLACEAAFFSDDALLFGSANFVLRALAGLFRARACPFGLDPPLFRVFAPGFTVRRVGLGAGGGFSVRAW